MKKTQRQITWEKFLRNALTFTAPALALFFGELALGKSFSEAWPIALIAFWGICADFYRKYQKIK